MLAYNRVPVEWPISVEIKPQKGAINRHNRASYWHAMTPFDHKSGLCIQSTEYSAPEGCDIDDIRHTDACFDDEDWIFRVFEPMRLLCRIARDTDNVEPWRHLHMKDHEM